MRLRPTRIVIGTLLAVLAAVAVPAAWLFGTESGLVQLLGLASHAPGVTIAARGVRGTLGGGFEIDELVIDHERVRVVARGLRARLDPLDLPILRLRLTSLAAHDVAVALKPAVRPPDGAPVAFMPGALRLVVERLTVAALDIRAPAGGAMRLTEIAAAIELARSRVVATQLHANGGIYLVDGRATLLAGAPLGLDADVTFTARFGELRLSGSIAAAGTLAALAVTAAAVAPRGASFTGALALIDVPHVDGRLALDRFDPGVLGLAAGDLTGTLDFRGSLDRFTIDGRLAAARLPFGSVAVTVAGGFERESLRLERLVASTEATAGIPPARVSAAGRIDLGARPRIELHGDWTGVRWPIAARNALVTSPSGTFRIAGGGPFEYELRAALSAPRLPATTLVARGTVDGTRLTVASFDASLAGGLATGSAALGFSGPRPWYVALSGRGIDPGAFRAPLKGHVNFDMRAEGEGFEPFGHWDARLERLDGTVRGLAARGRGAIQVRGSELRVENVKLAFGSAELDASGALGTGGAFRWRLKVDRLGDFLDGAAGSIRSRGVLSGDLAHLSAQGTLGARDFGFGGWHAAEVTAEADFDATDRRPSSLRLAALQVGPGVSRADQFRVTLDGRASAHTLGMRLISGAESGELAARGAYQNGVWTLHLESLRVSGPPLLAYRLTGPSTLILSRDAASLTRSCVVREDSSICAQGTWSNARPWAGSLDAAALPLKLTGIGMPKDMEYGGSVSVHVAAHGAPGQAWTGEGMLELADAEFRYLAPNGHLERVRLDRGSAKIQADPGAYSGTVELTTAGGSSVAASVRVRRDDGPLAQAPLTGALSISTTELGALPIFIPGVDRIAGRLEADLKLSGAAGAPLLAGTTHLTSGEIDIHRTNLLLRSVDAQLAIDGDAVTLSASATTRGGSATAAGQMRWRDRAPAGEFEFKGERLLVADLPELKIVASPQLHFAVDRSRITVRGDVTIPSARIAPRDLRSAVIASGDERIVTEEAPPLASALAVDSVVRLVLGDDVAIDAYGLKGKLGGSLLVTAHSGEVPYGSGELNVREGKYTAYSRELDIDRGRLLFAGQSLGNPGIDVRAQRRIDTTIAGVNVRGTLLKPQITFYSDPAMSQSQIAAMLILGTTFDDIQDAKTPGSGTGANSATSVAIGKFLLPNLYVSYGVSLTEAINTLKLRYTIGDRWVIRTESGVAQSIDIEYTIAR
jgi:translocation and assembly module TamB